MKPKTYWLFSSTLPKQVAFTFSLIATAIVGTTEQIWNTATNWGNTAPANATIVQYRHRPPRLSFLHKGGCRFAWEVVPSKSYSIETIDDLSGLQTAGLVTAIAMILFVASVGDEMFYRAKILP